MARRGAKDGSIYQRKDGFWCASLTLGTGRRKVVYGGTREEVRRKLGRLSQARDQGQVTDARGLTVGRFLDEWLNATVRPSVRHWTYVGYEVVVRRHLKPGLGQIGLERLTPMQVQGLLNSKLEAGLSPKSVRSVRAVLRAALNQAIRWGMVASNAAALASPPKVRRPQVHPFSPDEARSFLAAIADDRMAALYRVAVTLGLRQGEALGLEWRCVDLEKRLLRVEKQLQRIGGQFVLVELKTAKSRRLLAMPDSLAITLGEHRRRQVQERLAAGPGWKDTDLVFTTETGRPLEASTVLRHFKQRLQDADLPARRFHDLRHSCATLLLVQGVSPRVVMEILGHSDISMTLNTYSHVLPDLSRDAARRMDELLSSRSISSEAAGTNRTLER